MKFYTRIAVALLTLSIVFAAYNTVAAKDEWIKVKSKNFLLVGNASEKDIRKVGTRLEQFRETFRLLFSQMNLTSPIQTNVIVFKNDSSYKNFKPKRSDGKIDTFVSGFFQPGEDVNYITLSTEGDDTQTYSTIFHEYVHFIVDTNFGKSEVPAWFNEGLAEYYSTFEIEADQKIKLGLPQSNHVLLLRDNTLMPLDELFGVSNYQLLQTGSHSRSIFYAESWALIHYLMQSGKEGNLGTFLAFLLKDIPPEKAFQDAFQTTYPQMEGDLRKYVGKSSFQYNIFELKNKLLFDAGMQVSPLDDADSDAFLGDLLYHNHRVDDAEPFLVNALKLKGDSSMANTTLGMVKLKQRKFDEARAYFEKAIASDQKNHNAFYQYAYLLSREGRDEFGYVQRFDASVIAKMRDALRRAIALNPAFTASYDLLAFVDLVNNDELDDAVALLKSALKYQPGNQRYSLRIAEIYARQNKLEEARQLAEKIARTSDEDEIKVRAENLVAQVARQKDDNERIAAERKQYEEAVTNAGGTPRLTKRIENVKKPSDAELARRQEEESIRSINDLIRKPAENEQRVIGHIQKVDCKKGAIIYTVMTPSETFTVASKNFDTLLLNSLDPAATNHQVGCEADISSFNALVTYRVDPPSKGVGRGELVALEFVPANFRVMTEKEMNDATLMIYDQPDQGPDHARQSGVPPSDVVELRRAMMMQGVRDALKKPADGQRRDIGYLEAIECNNKGTFFIMRTATGVLRLLKSTSESLKITRYTPDVEFSGFACGIKPVEFPAVFIYNDRPDPKAKSSGDIVSLEFVPKSFVIEP